MRAITTIHVDGFEIVCGVGRPVENPVASKRKAEEALGPNATYHELITEMMRAPEYFDTIPGQSNVSNDEGAELEEKLRCLHTNERITRAGEIVADNRGREWFCFKDVWLRGAVKTIGEELPEGALWARDLSREQVDGIKMQDEGELISRDRKSVV